jgi:hypothetical protein
MNERNRPRKEDDPKSEYERLPSFDKAQDDKKGTERDAPMAPAQNRPPSQQHRGGPLPNHKK